VADIEVPRMMKNKMAAALGLDPTEVPRKMDGKVTPVYICNASGQDLNGVFGVHPHGWWGYGRVAYNPQTKSMVTQYVLPNNGQLTVLAADGDAALITPTAGRSLYITNLVLAMADGTAAGFTLEDGDGGTTKGGGAFSAVDITEYRSKHPINAQQPVVFNTSLFIDGAAGMNNGSLYWSAQGWEQ